MISLIDIILEDYDSRKDAGYERGYGNKIDTTEQDPMSIWLTDKRQWGAKNTYGQLRYFNNKDDAVQYAQGTTKGKHPQHPKRPRFRIKRQKKVTDDNAAKDINNPPKN